MTDEPQPGGGHPRRRDVPPMRSAEEDALLLANILAQPSDTWPDPASWARTHSLSATYVQTQFRAALSREQFARKPEPPPKLAEASTRTPEQAEHDFLAHIRHLRPTDTKYGLAREFGLSVTYVRQLLRENGAIGVPDTRADMSESDDGNGQGVTGHDEHG